MTNANLLCNTNFQTRRRTRRAYTSLAEADHYPHTAQYGKYALTNVGLTSKVLVLAPRTGHAKTITSVFLILLIQEDLDCHQNLISSSLCYPGSLQKISLQSIYSLSNVTYNQTDRHTNQRYQKHNLLCQGGKNVFTYNIVDGSVRV